MKRNLCGKSLFAMFFALAVSTLSAAPGDLDATFGNGGIVIKPVMTIGHYYQASSILLQPDGKILVSGQIDEYGDMVSYFIARFNSNGSPDLSFGYQGMILSAIEYGGACVGADIALQPDGKIIAVGVQGNEIAVHRFNAWGMPDNSFGGGGIVNFTPPGTIGGGADAVALQSDGKIVIVGNAWTSGQNTPGLIVRFNPDGSLDSSFGVDGLMTASLGEWTRLYRIFVQPSGKLLTFGVRRPVLNSNTSDIAVIRYNPDGSPDSTFGSNGTVIASHGEVDFYSGAGLQADGKIVVSSGGYNSSTNGPNYRALVRYNDDGSVDSGFSASGLSFTNPIFNFTFQPDGKIVAFGSNSVPGSPNVTGISVVRLHPDGSIDSSFGTNGASAMGSYDYYRVSRGVMQKDGKILVLGYPQDYNAYEFSIARYLGDPTLSVAGRVTSPNGLGLRNAVVTLTDSAGNRRSALTSTLGFYSFAEIPTGETVIISAASRRYRFQPITRTVDENLSDVDFVGIE